jgi:nitrogen fixation protein NifU and related proteins
MKDELYQQAILAQASAAVRAGRIEAPDASVTLDNPLCGDRVTIELTMDGDRIADLAHRVRGCLLCEAAASVIGANAVGQTAEAVAAAENAIRAMLGEAPTAAAAWTGLEAFQPVREYRSRHACVLLPFETLSAALAQARAAVR